MRAPVVIAVKAILIAGFAATLSSFSTAWRIAAGVKDLNSAG